MEQQIEALKIALLQGDDKAGQAAAVAVLCSVALLLDRGVLALETIAGTIDLRYDNPAIRTREG